MPNGRLNWRTPAIDDQACGKTLDGPDLADFLRTPLADLGGILPLDLAEGNSTGLGLAQEALRQFAESRHAERVATEWRSKLDSEAWELFGDRAARVVRQSVDGKLDGRPPLIYCRDERTFRVALGVLHWMRKRCNRLSSTSVCTPS
ncbi:hypothetical protein NKJ70_23110 [Mesorhizobium sp. M0092]|uniref:hypothetical protein n=1 Tax=Mesorhizobium sp. M0092 TaxID=2956876 RepID=UPI003338548A